MSTSWYYLICAGLLEVCWAGSLKYTQGFTRLWPTLFTLITLTASMLLLAKAVRDLPIGTAYAVWVGIGAFGAAVVGIILFEETVSVLRLSFLAMLLVSIIGLKLTSA